MAIIRNGKIYRNLQEQVLENADNIDQLFEASGYHGPYDTLEDITNPIDRALYLVGTTIPYEIYQYSELVQNFKDLGPFAAVGPQGPTGPQGAQGVQGPQGPQGETGEQGPTGPTGPQGPQGEQGPAGIGTRTFTYSSTIPLGVAAAISVSLISSENRPVRIGDIIVSTDISTDGNYAIALANETEDMYYLPIRGEGNVKGPQGEQGPTGPQGPQGETGPTGPQGLDGIQGEQGPQGEMGPTGPQGEQGPKGDTGEQGPTGPQGPQGEIGPTGPQGPQGEIGPTGATGPQGPIGPTGPAGADGLTTQITVNGTTYTQSGGNITLPDYPTVTTYSAGTGIDITNDTISLDTTPSTFEITASSGMTLMAENQNPLYRDAKLVMASSGATRLEGTDVSIEANSIHLNADSAPWYVNNTTHEYKVLATTDQIPTVGGKNDGTNWTSITLGSSTYSIPSGGASYSAGTGIDITSNTISVDTSTVAMKSDLSNYASITDLASLSSSVSTNTSNIASLTSQITDLASLTSSHTSQISALTSDVANCVTLSQLTSTLSDYVQTSTLTSTLADYVTLSTSQTITGTKTFRVIKLADLEGTNETSIGPTLISARTSSWLSITVTSGIYQNRFTLHPSQTILDAHRIGFIAYGYTSYEHGPIYFAMSHTGGSYTYFDFPSHSSGSYILATTDDLSNCVTLSQLSAYSPTSSYASVAFTGAYSDLSGLPTIPSYSLSKTTETWTFTLDDDSTVSKTILTDVTLVTS